MTKTLNANFADGTTKVITAKKVDIIIAGQSNLYRDDQGNYFMVQRGKCRGTQFYQLLIDDKKTAR